MRSRAGLSRRHWLILALGLLAAAALSSACGGSAGSTDSPFSSRVVALGGSDIYAEIANSTLAVGENRFVLLLFDQENDAIFGAPIIDSKVHLRFFDLTGEEPRLGPEADAREIRITRSFTHDHGDGIIESHHAGETAFYIAYINFDRPGRWGVEIAASLNGENLDPIPFQFEVHEQSPEPAIGDPAPRTRQSTLTDVADISEIDSSYPSRPHMHEMTVADALAAGKPVVIAFATPAFCVTRVCGPIMDAVVDPLFEKYRVRVNFIHVEPYDLKKAREGIGLFLTETMKEWGLKTEPWLFVIDREGRIAAKFEGIAAVDEVEGVLETLLGEPTPSRPAESVIRAVVPGSC